MISDFFTIGYSTITFHKRQRSHRVSMAHALGEGGARARACTMVSFSFFCRAPQRSAYPRSARLYESAGSHFIAPWPSDAPVRATVDVHSVFKYSMHTRRTWLLSS